MSHKCHLGYETALMENYVSLHYGRIYFMYVAPMSTCGPQMNIESMRSFVFTTNRKQFVDSVPFVYNIRVVCMCVSLLSFTIFHSLLFLLRHPLLKFCVTEKISRPPRILCDIWLSIYLFFNTSSILSSAVP